MIITFFVKNKIKIKIILSLKNNKSYKQIVFHDKYLNTKSIIYIKVGT